MTPVSGDRLQGKVAVVTGAASGIGKASVRRFLEEGARVVAGDVDEPGLGALAQEAGEAPLRWLAGDVTDPATSEALVDEATGSFGRLDVFYANAGGAPGRPVDATSHEQYRAALALNLDSVWYAAKASLRVMLPQGRGVILATSSGAGLGAVRGLAPYGAAKAGIQALVRSLALEYGARGIRACAIAPGPMETPGLLGYLDSLPGGREAFAAGIPMQRLGRPEDVAAAATFLASEDAAYVSGVTLPVDGAIHAALSQPKLD